MDVQRKQPRRGRRLVRGLVLTAAVTVVTVTTVGLSRLEGRLPVVERGSVYIGTAERGELVRELRGAGTLVPRQARWVTAPVAGRVERVLVDPGGQVEADTPLCELANPEIEAALRDAEWSLRRAEADVEALEQRLETELLDREAAVAKAEAELNVARLELERDEESFSLGLVAEFNVTLARSRVGELERILELEHRRAEVRRRGAETERRRQVAELAQARSARDRQAQRAESLTVRAGRAGVVDQVQAETGQSLSEGATVARVIDPRDLEARLQLPEAQVRDLRPGQRVEIDTRNGILEASVSRIDPAPQGGTVGVDVELEGPLPPHARPDLSVTGSVLLERLPDVLTLGRPAGAREGATIELFRLSGDGATAERVAVRLGAVSIRNVEVVEGLSPGDRVILSSLTSHSGDERIALE